MPREKYQRLTEQMFYILICLQAECCGMDVMTRVETITEGRITIGPGTLYHLLESFQQEGMIRETKVEGRRRSYLITERGKRALEEEYQRLVAQVSDYQYYGSAEVAAVSAATASKAAKGGAEDEGYKVPRGVVPAI